MVAAQGGTKAFPRSERSAPLCLVQHPPPHLALPSTVLWPPAPGQPHSCTQILSSTSHNLSQAWGPFLGAGPLFPFTLEPISWDSPPMLLT